VRVQLQSCAVGEASFGILLVEDPVGVAQR
jgi:hypothetical protein